MLEKGQILRPFFRPSALKIKKNHENLRVDYVYKDKSFDIIFDMGYWSVKIAHRLEG